MTTPPTRICRRCGCDLLIVDGEKREHGSGVFQSYGRCREILARSRARVPLPSWPARKPLPPLPPRTASADETIANEDESWTRLLSDGKLAAMVRR